MTRKLDSLGQRILLLLESEPNGLIWRDVLHNLWPSCEGKYKDIKSFSSALTQKLTRMVAKGIIKKEGNWYGTLKSFPITQEETGVPKPKEHILKIANGLLALCGAGKYRIEGRPYPEEEFREPALMHVKTGYRPIYQSVLEMAKWRPACLEPDVKKTDECMKEHEKAKDAFDKIANLLIERLVSGIDKLGTSWCKICEEMQGKTINTEEEAEVRNILKILWNVTV